jgi:hypothetical protein
MVAAAGGNCRDVLMRRFIGRSAMAVSIVW